MIKKYTLTLVAACIMITQSWAQGGDSIELENPSFEDVPHAGGGDGYSGIRSWFDCGRINFPTETPPDIHPGGFWKNMTSANDGATYLGMVVRENNSWEAVSQRLSTPLEAGKCYTLSIDLCKSNEYMSKKKISETELTDSEYPFTTPAVLRVWGGAGACSSNQLLGESDPVKHEDWRRYTFEFEPNLTVRSITLEAFYKTPVLDPYNGNLLLDNLSAIEVVPCPGEEIIAAVEEKPKEKAVPPHKRRKPKPAPETKKEEVVTAAPAPKKILDLDRKKMYKGQKINIDNLYFDVNVATITKESHKVLDEVVDFMLENKDVQIEIGGHTNTIPPHAFCDSLSRVRAKAVATYLRDQGVPAKQLQFYGYGKRKPITRSRRKEDRARNQRVEIKILSLGE